MWSKRFWKATAERVVRGAAIAASTTMGLQLVDATNPESLATLPTIGLAALFGGLGSLFLSLAGGTFGSGDGPSFTGQEELDRPLNG